MEKLQIVVEGSEKEIQQMIENNVKGWKLFLVEPSDVTYKFINLFWGFPWDGTHETLRDLMINKVKIEGVRKHAIWVFKWNGEDRFAYCTWTRELYDFHSKAKYIMEPKIATNIAYKIRQIMEAEDNVEQMIIDCTL